MERKLNCVLLIDDDEATNFLNQLLIENTGCARGIVIKHNGHEALQYLRNISSEHPEVSRPDLIFLDLNMPAMNGWEFLEEYHMLGLEQKGKMMIVMLTTSLFLEDKKKAMQAPGISGFENKPLTKEKLEQILHNFFENDVANS